MVQHKIFVITLCEFELFIIMLDPFADRRWRTKVERRTRDRSQFSGGDKSRIDGSVPIGWNGEDVIQNISLTFPRQVEIAVVGQVEDSVCIRSCEILDFQRVCA